MTTTDSLTAHGARVRIQIHYIEMPGLKLSRAQLARLCGLPEPLCADALSTLLWSGFLAETADGLYVRSGERRAAAAS